MPPAGEGEADVKLSVAGCGIGEGGVLALQGRVLRLVPGRAAEEEKQGKESAPHWVSG